MKLNQNIQIIGRTVTLVPYRKNQVEKYHQWMTNPELRELTRSEPLSLDQEYDMLRSWAEDEDKCTFIVLNNEPGCSKDDEVDRMIGDVNLFLNHDGPNTAEIDVMIAETSARRHGCGLETVKLMMNYAIENLSINRFIAKIVRSNTPSLRLFEQKLGYVKISESEVFDEVTLELVIREEVLLRLKSGLAYDVCDYNN